MLDSRGKIGKGQQCQPGAGKHVDPILSTMRVEHDMGCNQDMGAGKTPDLPRTPPSSWARWRRRGRRWRRHSHGH
jgi:hypothetical protein